ncbi:MAG: glutathione-disulfide reductase [Myxococcales bacterium]|nr:glutathione-disulfide reductase [Myxococcales bacterium]
MGDFDYDLFVIGAGSGGVRASRVAASHGARVAVAEEGRLGGTCVNVGCVPKKLLVYASSYAQAFEDSAGFGWREGSREHRWPQLIAAKDREITRLNAVYRRMLDASGVEVVEARARVVGPNTVSVGGREISARYILLATGGRPFVPAIPGVELAITSNEAFYLDELPRRMAIVGGGYIAVEFAGIFNGLGVETQLVYRGDLVLRGFDLDIRATLSDELRKAGIIVHYNSAPAALEQREAGIGLLLRDGGELEADRIMMATGRVPNSADLGLEQVGVKLNERGAVVVDAYSQSSVASIYAVGDVTDRIALTPVAIAEGKAVADTLFGGAESAPDHDNVPSAVFSQPNVATVGLTESEARARFAHVDVYRASFRPMRHTLSGRDTRSLMKLVVDRETERVLGCHMVGEDAGEIIQGLAVALKCGATKSQFDATIGIHPTAAEEFVTMRTPV